MNEQLKTALDRDVREDRGAGVDCLGGDRNREQKELSLRRDLLRQPLSRALLPAFQ